MAALDQLAESELSSLNRQIAERQEETLFKGFKESLLFNLGLVSLNMFAHAMFWCWDRLWLRFWLQ